MAQSFVSYDTRHIHVSSSCGSYERLFLTFTRLHALYTLAVKAHNVFRILTSSS